MGRADITMGWTGETPLGAEAMLGGGTGGGTGGSRCTGGGTGEMTIAAATWTRITTLGSMVAGAEGRVVVRLVVVLTTAEATGAITSTVLQQLVGVGITMAVGMVVGVNGGRGRGMTTTIHSSQLQGREGRGGRHGGEAM